MNGFTVREKHNAQNASAGGRNTAPAAETSVGLDFLAFGVPRRQQDPFVQNGSPVGPQTHVSEIGGALHRARTADGGSERLSERPLQSSLYPKKGALRQASRQAPHPRHPTKGTTVQRTKGPDPRESASIGGFHPTERCGSASRSAELGTEAGEVRRGLPPLPHPRHRRNPRSKIAPRKPQISQMTQMTNPDSCWCFSKPIGNAFGRHSFSTIRGGRPRLHQAAPIRVPSCPFVVPSLVRVRGHNGPQDRIRVNPCPSVVATPRSDSGAHHEPRRLEQKHRKFGKAYRRPLILRPRSAAAGGIATCQQPAPPRR